MGSCLCCCQKKHTIQRRVTQTDHVTVHRAETLKDQDYVNQYRVLGTLGQGSYGKVLRVRDQINHEIYAMKILNKGKLAKQSQGLRRIRTAPANAMGGTPAEDPIHHEIAIMKQLTHPNLVTLIEIMDDPDDNTLYVVMEYMEKGSVLPEMPPCKVACENKSRKYFRDILIGLEYLHSHHIIHRDLKPENVLLGRDGHIKISDFGMSLNFGDTDMVSTVAGTAAFLAPEVCEAEDGTSFHGKGVDIWALGATLYVLLYGQLPFGKVGDSVWATYAAIIKEPLVIPPKPILSDDCTNILLRLLEKNWETRITMAELRVHPWVTQQGKEPLDVCFHTAINVSVVQLAAAVTKVREKSMNFGKKIRKITHGLRQGGKKKLAKRTGKEDPASSPKAISESQFESVEDEDAPTNTNSNSNPNSAGKENVNGGSRVFGKSNKVAPYREE